MFLSCLSRLTRRPAARAVAAACAISLLPVAPAGLQAQVSLPALGDSVSSDFGPGTERRLGEQVMRDIRRDPDYLDDPLLLEYLQSIWEPLVAAARQRGNINAETDSRFAWEVFLVRDRSVNAFALPGGFVGVHLGLIAMTATSDELASVLAHELSHVTQRHIARSLANQGRQSLIATAAMILGVIAASRAGSPDGVSAAIAGGQAVAIQGMLNYSRDMEREADRVGFGVFSAAGFAPAGMATMFDKLDAASRLNDSNSFPYLRTHPLTTERVGEARARLGTTRAAAPGSQLEDEVMRAHARVLMDTREESLRREQAADAQSGQLPAGKRLAMLVASAEASIRLRDTARAEKAIEAALAVASGGAGSDARALRAVRLIQVQVLLAGGDAQRAAAALRAVPDDGSRPLRLARVQVALADSAGDGRAEALRRSAEDLQTWVATHPNDAMAWEMLAQAWTKAGRPLRAVRAEAESRVAIGDLTGAADRLRAGQRLAREPGVKPDEFIEVSVIDARLREIEAQRRQLAAEMRGNGSGRDGSRP